MLLFHKSKDGGPDSTVTGYWLIEWKAVFSVVLLKFDGESREAFHSHAFNAISWLIKGGLVEEFLDGRIVKHNPSLKPICTPRNAFHKVNSVKGITWVLSFRGPWSKTWQEYLPDEDIFITLKNGRKLV
jgi:hypothetical protein